MVSGFTSFLVVLLITGVVFGFWNSVLIDSYKKGTAPRICRNHTLINNFIENTLPQILVLSRNTKTVSSIEVMQV